VVTMATSGVNLIGWWSGEWSAESGPGGGGRARGLPRASGLQTTHQTNHMATLSHTIFLGRCSHMDAVGRVGSRGSPHNSQTVLISLTLAN
jgi:hypothetical protein